MLERTAGVRALVSKKVIWPFVPELPREPVHPLIVNPEKLVELNDANCKVWEPVPRLIWDPATGTDNWPNVLEFPVVAPVLNVPPAREIGPVPVRTFAAPNCSTPTLTVVPPV